MRALLGRAAARRIAASTPLRRRPPATASAAARSASSASAEDYTPHHITATAADMQGNGPHGRYWLVPGSMDRAAQLATHLTDPVAVRESPRGHHAHLGVLERADGPPVDVGIVSTGMGCPTVDIILTELIRLGGRRFIRIGSAGYPNATQPTVARPFFARFAPFFRRSFALSGFLVAEWRWAQPTATERLPSTWPRSRRRSRH